jgi:hypothetical protein
MTTVWANRVADAKPQRMVTFTRIGQTRDDIRIGLQHILRRIRGGGFAFDYWGVVELHKSGVPHMHVVQRGNFIPKAKLAEACRKEGWGFSDIRQISEGWSAARYCSKHLCHSHGRRWNGRLIRYSRQFFPETQKQRKAAARLDGIKWEVVHGRASHITAKMRNRGQDVVCGEMGEDWIMGEVKQGEIVELRYLRDQAKGYLQVVKLPHHGKYTEAEAMLRLEKFVEIARAKKFLADLELGKDEPESGG